MRESEKIILIDICGTIFDSNTTFDFLDTMLRVSSYRRYRRFSKSFLWRAFNKICFIVFKVDWTRKIAVSYLKGYSENDLLQMSEQFYNDFLLKKQKMETIKLIKELQESKDNRLILVSATLDCIASVVAKKLKIVDVLSTSLRYEKSCCLGKIREDLLGRKLQILKKHHIMPLYDVMITNDYSDIDVIFQSRKSYVVVENNIKRWQYLLNKGSYVNYIFIK